MAGGSTNVATGTGLGSAAKVKLELLTEDPGSEFMQDGKVRVTLYESDGTTVVASRKVRMHIPGR